MRSWFGTVRVGSVVAKGASITACFLIDYELAACNLAMPYERTDIQGIIYHKYYIEYYISHTFDLSCHGVNFFAYLYRNTLMRINLRRVPGHDAIQTPRAWHVCQPPCDIALHLSPLSCVYNRRTVKLMMAITIYCAAVRVSKTNVCLQEVCSTMTNYDHNIFI